MEVSAGLLRSVSKAFLQEARPPSTFEQLEVLSSAVGLKALHRSMQLRLGLDGPSSLLMLPTMVDVQPQGHEKGECYAIDFGGSNLRVLYTRLGAARKEVEIDKSEKSPFPAHYRTCPAEELFDYVVSRLVTFSAANGWPIKERQRPLVGFCFSYPTDMMSIDSGVLIKWTKGFDNPGAVGKDPVKMLTDAFQRAGIHAEVGSLVNDSTATLAAARYLDGPDTVGAVIMGTGTNACYVEQLGNIHKWLPQFRPRTPDMVVNIEWPGFWSTELPRLPEDELLDAESRKPGQQRFEKLTAGLYMGEITRRILLRFAEQHALFGGAVPDALRRKQAVESGHINEAVEDTSLNLVATAGMLQRVLGLEGTTLQQRQQVRAVSVAVVKRSARLTAAALGGILSHLGRSPDTPGPPRPTKVAVDGGILVGFETHRRLLEQGVAELLGPALAEQFSLMVISGGSAFGAACVAAASHHYMKAVGGVSTPPVRKFPARRRLPSSP